MIKYNVAENTSRYFHHLISLTCFRYCPHLHCHLCPQLLPSTWQLEDVLFWPVTSPLSWLAGVSCSLTPPLHQHGQWHWNLLARTIMGLFTKAWQVIPPKICRLYLWTGSNGCPLLPCKSQSSIWSLHWNSSPTSRIFADMFGVACDDRHFIVLFNGPQVSIPCMKKVNGHSISKYDRHIVCHTTETHETFQVKVNESAEQNGKVTFPTFLNDKNKAANNKILVMVLLWF